MNITHTPETPLFPSHPTWGFTDDQRRGLTALTQIPGFSKLVEIDAGFERPFVRINPSIHRKPCSFQQVVITDDGAYHSFWLCRTGQPFHQYSTSGASFRR